MSSEFRKQIYSELNLKETDELLEIWHTNDHEEWSDAAFDVVLEILIERLGEVPIQEKIANNREKNVKGLRVKN